MRYSIPFLAIAAAHAAAVPLSGLTDPLSGVSGGGADNSDCPEDEAFGTIVKPAEKVAESFIEPFVDGFGGEIGGGKIGGGDIGGASGGGFGDILPFGGAIGGSTKGEGLGDSVPAAAVVPEATGVIGGSVSEATGAIAGSVPDFTGPKAETTGALYPGSFSGFDFPESEANGGFDGSIPEVTGGLGGIDTIPEATGAFDGSVPDVTVTNPVGTGAFESSFPFISDPDYSISAGEFTIEPAVGTLAAAVPTGGVAGFGIPAIDVSTAAVPTINVGFSTVTVPTATAAAAAAITTGILPNIGLKKPEVRKAQVVTSIGNLSDETLSYETFTGVATTLDFSEQAQATVAADQTADLSDPITVAVAQPTIDVAQPTIDVPEVSISIATPTEATYSATFTGSAAGPSATAFVSEFQGLASQFRSFLVQAEAEFAKELGSLTSQYSGSFPALHSGSIQGSSVGDAGNDALGVIGAGDAGVAGNAAGGVTGSAGFGDIISDIEALAEQFASVFGFGDVVGDSEALGDSAASFGRGTGQFPSFDQLGDLSSRISSVMPGLPAPTGTAIGFALPTGDCQAQGAGVIGGSVPLVPTVTAAVPIATGVATVVPAIPVATTIGGRDLPLAIPEGFSVDGLGF